MAPWFYRALESVGVASALSTALTIYPCQIRVHQRWQSKLQLLTARKNFTADSLPQAVYLTTVKHTALSSTTAARRWLVCQEHYYAGYSLFSMLRANCVLGEEFGPHNAITPGPSLAEDHGAYSVPFVCPCLPLFARQCPTVPRRVLHLTSDTEACRRLRSGSTSTLFVPAT